MSRRCVRTSEVDNSIWLDVREDAFRRHLVELEERTNAVPIAPQIFDASNWSPIYPYATGCHHTLPLEIEMRLADDFACLAAVEEGAQSVAAVCIEEHTEDAKLTLRFAALDTTLNDTVQEALREISSLLAVVSVQDTSTIPKSLDRLFTIVVRLHYRRLLARLRSSKWEKPAYLSKSHKKPLWQDFKNVLHRVQFMYTKREKRQRLVVEQLLGELEQVYKQFDEASENDIASLEGLVTSSYATITSPEIQDYVTRLEASVGTLPTAQVASAIKSLKQIQKVAAYRRICISLLEIVQEYPQLFDTGMLMDFVVPFQSVPTAIGYEEWATTCHVHAEIQLAVHYDLVFQNSQPNFLPPRVIGVSKWLCYLCYQFLHAHGRLFPSRTHGRLYDQWTIPDLAEFGHDTMKRYRAAVKLVDMEVLRHIDCEPELRRLEPMTSNDVYGK
ncbi:hypothetical protein GLAREA_03621 [Glarea lozoyensis ATCC 20868]|uniref:Uncharacterized protein n=1 Tax=Glarea lozoyensis (strain ATCC 20868 / MF5171) TaxID=1116229 RepID=S3D0F9_GLAL2|nr:uncharacterized protein GLAREA_03621 [Glarea lozoyensis ATCC 20868]EPE30654.1 hypothetical protein GLAREA_03621 [Glarea lozoyensis ATCC 20868]